MSGATVLIELTPAQVQVALQALHAWQAVIDGDVDGKRRCPWDHWGMDADEGAEVPGALTHELGYRMLLNTARDTLTQAVSQT